MICTGDNTTTGGVSAGIEGGKTWGIYEIFLGWVARFKAKHIYNTHISILIFNIIFVEMTKIPDNQPDHFKSGMDGTEEVVSSEMFPC